MRINLVLERAISQFSERQIGDRHPLFDAIRYATMNKGKRVRPALAYAIADALQIELRYIDSAAAALEMIHSYSLVHDDLPAMDDDDLRRGQPTCHIQFDEATAILVGDAQQSLAFQLVSEDDTLDAQHKVEILHLLSATSGPLGMIGGQMLDLRAEEHQVDLQQLKTLHILKTARLIQCALLIGAVKHPEYTTLKPALWQLGELIGLAFQVHDDIIDIESSTETLGKPQGSDQLNDKSTYPKLMGLDKAKQYRDELLNEAKNLLNNSAFKHPFIADLIDYIGSRDH